MPGENVLCAHRARHGTRHCLANRRTCKLCVALHTLRPPIHITPASATPVRAPPPHPIALLLLAKHSAPHLSGLPRALRTGTGAPSSVCVPSAQAASSVPAAGQAAATPPASCCSCSCLSGARPPEPGEMAAMGCGPPFARLHCTARDGLGLDHGRPRQLHLGTPAELRRLRAHGRCRRGSGGGGGVGGALSPLPSSALRCLAPRGPPGGDMPELQPGTFSKARQTKLLNRSVRGGSFQGGGRGQRPCPHARAGGAAAQGRFRFPPPPMGRCSRPPACTTRRSASRSCTGYQRGEACVCAQRPEPEPPAHTHTQRPIINAAVVRRRTRGRRLPCPGCSNEWAQLDVRVHAARLPITIHPASAAVAPTALIAGAKA